MDAKISNKNVTEKKRNKSSNLKKWPTVDNVYNIHDNIINSKIKQEYFI